jgi:hypothetical protein
VREGEARHLERDPRGLVGEPVQRLDDLRGEALEEGEHFVAQPDAYETSVQVRRVAGRRDSVPLEVQLDVRSPGTDERAQPRSLEDGEDPQRRQRRSPKDTQEDGLGAVVRRVGGRDHLGAHARSLRVEQPVAGLASAGLEVGASRELRFEHRARDAERARQREHPLDLSLGLPPEPMIHGRCVELEPEILAE